MIQRILRASAALFVPVVLAVPGHAQAVGDLEAGVRAYTERGDPREAIRQIGGALDAGAIPMASRPRAHVYMAHAFLALGDTASAMPHIETAFAVEPCLVPAPDLTPPAWQALYDRSRPAGASCGRKLVSAGLQSLVIPGWGQRSLGRSGASNYFFGTTVAAVGGAILFRGRADRHYDAYQTSNDYIQVAQLYAQAEEARRRAVILGGAGVAIYAWNVVDAMMSGAEQDRQIAAVRPVAFVPMVTPSQDGVTVAFQLRVR